MNYYPFHLGDYAAHTAHLEPMEDIAYRRMLDLYYLREDVLPLEPAEVARLIRMRSNVAEVESVLGEFFVRTGAGWAHVRCEAEIAKMQDKQAKAKASAQASVNARQANAQRTLNERSTKVELPTPTPTPKTENLSVPTAPHPPGKPDVVAAPSVADPPDPPPPDKPSVPCPYAEIVAAYHVALPSLPRVRLMPTRRQAAMRKFWGWVLSSRKSDGTRRAESAAEALAWIRAYFDRAAQNDFLTGRSARNAEHAGWQCDLDFLVSERGMKHVIEKTQEHAE